MEFRGFAGLPRCRRRGWSAFADHDWDRGDFGLSGAQSILFFKKYSVRGRTRRKRSEAKASFLKKRSKKLFPVASRDLSTTARSAQNPVCCKVTGALPPWLNPGAIMGQVRLWALRAAADPTREAPGKSFLLLFFKKEDFALRFLRSSDLEFRGFAGLPRCRRRGWSAFADHDWDRGDFGLSGAQSKEDLPSLN